MPNKKNVPDDAPAKPAANDLPDDFFATASPPAPPQYWKALHIIARFHRIDLELLRGSADQTKPSYEHEFYLQLARVFLKQSGEPDGVWDGARGLVALKALEMDVSALIRAHQRRRAGRRYNGRDALLAVADGTSKAIAAAAVVCEYSGFPLHKPGRPSRPTKDGASIEADFQAANVNFSVSWREGRRRYEDYLNAHRKIMQPAERIRHIRKAREVFRRLAEHHTRVAQAFPASD
jgi:hypothetical protein